MSGRAFNLGLFGRVYALMLVSVLVSQSLLILMIATTAPPTPVIVDYDRVLAAVRIPAEAQPPLETETGPRPRLRENGGHGADLLASAVARDLGLAPSDIRASISVVGPPLKFGVWPESRIREGERPNFVAGDFVIERRNPAGGWVRISSGDAFAEAALRRFTWLLIATSVIISLPALLLALRLTRPFAQFASAAERLGRDPEAPKLSISGPPEVRTAAGAFNDMQTRLRRYIDERTSMVTAIAHDLRTPLTRMSFILEDAEPKLRERLMRQIQEMQMMLSAVLGYLKSERSRYEREALDLGSLIDAVCQNAAEADPRVRCHPYERIVVLGDAQALASAFRNLIDNALATSATQVEIMIEPTEGEVRVRVEDDGPGLPEELLTRVFDPFVRVDPSRNRSTGGVGLGLTLVRAAAVAHGGSVTLRNRSPHGLTAEVVLPRWNR